MSNAATIKRNGKRQKLRNDKKGTSKNSIIVKKEENDDESKVGLDFVKDLKIESDHTYQHYRDYGELPRRKNTELNKIKDKQGNEALDYYALTDDVLIKYRPYIKGRDDIALLKEVGKYLYDNGKSSNIIGLLKTIRDLKNDVEQSNNGARKDKKLMYEAKCVDDFQSFLNKKTCNMFRSTFSMVRIIILILFNMKIYIH